MKTLLLTSLMFLGASTALATGKYCDHEVKRAVNSQYGHSGFLYQNGPNDGVEDSTGGNAHAHCTVNEPLSDSLEVAAIRGDAGETSDSGTVE